MKPIAESGEQALTDMFPVKNDLKQGDALLPLLFSFALKYASRRVPLNQDGLKLNGKHQDLVHADYVNISGGNVILYRKTQKFQ